jgi:hypothetical protein
MSSEATRPICIRSGSCRWGAWWPGLPRCNSSSFERSSDATSGRSCPIEGSSPVADDTEPGGGRPAYRCCCWQPHAARSVDDALRHGHAADRSVDAESIRGFMATDSRRSAKKCVDDFKSRLRSFNSALGHCEIICVRDDFCLLMGGSSIS